MSCVPLQLVPSTHPQVHKDLFCHYSFAFLRMSYTWNPTIYRIVLHFLLLTKMHPGYEDACFIRKCMIFSVGISCSSKLQSLRSVRASSHVTASALPLSEPPVSIGPPCSHFASPTSHSYLYVSAFRARIWIVL